MTGRRTLTDDAIATMLRSRGSAPMPIGLARGVADAIATDAGARGSSDHSGRRAGGRSWPLLLVAAALLVTFGGSVLVLSRPTDDRTPPTPGPSAAVVLPSPTDDDLGSQPCQAPLGGIEKAALLGAGGSVDPSAIIGAADEPPQNGPILAMVGRDPTTPGSLPIDLWQIAPFPEGARDETRILGSWIFGRRGATMAMVPTPNGAAVALTVDPYEGPVLTQPDCADIVLVTTSDRRSAVWIFGASLGERFTDPTWSSDGSRLYAIRSNSRPCSEVTVSSTRTSYDCSTPLESSLVAWEVATDGEVDLGRPCLTCMPEGRPVLSPDGRQIAATYLDGSSGFGVAILDEAGRWSLVPSTAGTTWAALSGWLDEGRLQLMDFQGRAFTVDVETGAAESLAWRDGSRSPDGTRIASVVAADAPADGDGPNAEYVESTTIATGERTRIASPESALTRHLGRVTWSPDSQWLAMEIVDTNTGLHRLYVAPADGSAEPRLIPERADGPISAWAWLPATP